MRPLPAFICPAVKLIDDIPPNLARLVKKSGLNSGSLTSQYDHSSYYCGFSRGFCSSIGSITTIGLREDLLAESPQEQVEYVFGSYSLAMPTLRISSGELSSMLL